MTDRPRLRHQWSYLADVAADIHARRAAAFPPRVADGRMTQADADAACAAIAAVAADWRAAADRAPLDDRPGRPARAARLATLRSAHDRANILADRAATALLATLPAGSSLPDRDDMVNDHHGGARMSPAAETWVRALDYAAAIATLLWYEDGRAGDLRVLCAINADHRLASQIVADQAEAA